METHKKGFPMGLYILITLVIGVSIVLLYVYTITLDVPMPYTTPSVEVQEFRGVLDSQESL